MRRPHKSPCVLQQKAHYSTFRLESATKFVTNLALMLIALFSNLSATEGYYKDLFIDAGCDLGGATTIPPASLTMSLSNEFLDTEDKYIQNQKMVSSDIDINGCLLYPDGSARFRLMYVHGGWSIGHIDSLGAEGQKRIVDFYNNGGGYTGSCAGAWISYFLEIWSGTNYTTIGNVTVGLTIPQDSPLLRYYDFGGDYHIDNVYHNNGPWADETSWPQGGECLARFDYPSDGIHEKPAIWAYKNSDQSGRMIAISSHPESYGSGENFELMKAIFQYALDGQGDRVIKATLENGVIQEMNSNETEGHEKIGDLQYHHFKIELEKDAANFTIQLNGQTGYDFDLHFKKGGFAFQDSSDTSLTSESSNETLTLPYLEKGTYYVGVKNCEAVETTAQSWGTEYSGNTEVLNGLSYSLIAQWENSTGSLPTASSPGQNLRIGSITQSAEKIQFTISKCSEEEVVLRIFNSNGREVWRSSTASGTGGTASLSWHTNTSNATSGFYVALLQQKDKTASARFMVLK